MTTENTFKVQTSIGKADVWKISDHYYSVMYEDGTQPRVVSAEDVDKYFEEGAWQKVAINKPFRIQESSFNNKATVTLNPCGDSYTVAWDHWQDVPHCSSTTLPKHTVEGCFEHGTWEMIVPEQEPESICLLQQIKEFTNTCTVEVTIHNGIYQILDADNGDVWRANDDEELVKIMNAVKLLASAVVDE